jgi:hypothetical protein
MVVDANLRKGKGILNGWKIPRPPMSSRDSSRSNRVTHLFVTCGVPGQGKYQVRSLQVRQEHFKVNGVWTKAIY